MATQNTETVPNRRTPVPPAPVPQNADAQKLPPDQEKMRKLIVKQAMDLITSDGNDEQLVQRAEAGDPKQVVVNAVMPLLQTIYTTATAAGAKLEMRTLLAAGIEIIANLSELLATAQVISQEEIPAFAGEVGKMAVERHNAGAQKGEVASPSPPAAAGGGFAMGGMQ